MNTSPSMKSEGAMKADLSIEIRIAPGNASPEEIAEFFLALDALYRAHGGSGLKFNLQSEAPKAPGSPLGATGPTPSEFDPLNRPTYPEGYPEGKDGGSDG